MEPALAEHGRAFERLAPLRKGADDLVAERLHEAAELLDACRMGGIIDARELDADEDGARDGRFRFHVHSVARRGGVEGDWSMRRMRRADAMGPTVQTAKGRGSATLSCST